MKVLSLTVKNLLNDLQIKKMELERDIKRFSNKERHLGQIAGLDLAIAELEKLIYAKKKRSHKPIMLPQIDRTTSKI